ncbi:MAG: hypothetical protein [Microvirus sp.]|nr:MAG: hypothetical protein [Microvirus sp.]
MKANIMKRSSLSMKSSKRLFTNTAGSRHVHAKNMRGMPMRGGIRL